MLTGCSDNDKILLFLGDSLTSGEGEDPELTFPALVDRQFDGYRAISQGRPGWSTDTFLKKWDEVERDFPSHAEVVFIQLGTNDLMENGHEDATITNCINNMEMILQKVRYQFPEAEIVLMSSTIIDHAAMDGRFSEAGFGHITNTYLSRIAAGYSIIAAESDLNFIDLHRLVPLNNTIDGVHLKPTGHNIVANVIAKFLRELQQSKASES